MTPIQKTVSIIKQIGNIKFWASAITTSIIFTTAGYLISWKMVYDEYWKKYESLDKFAKSLMSIEDWWLETLLGGCIPMLIAFGVQFFLLKTAHKNKDIIFSALPFIPFLNFFAVKPFIFMFGTSSIFLGAILFLGIEGDPQYLWGLIIPACMYGASFTLRYRSSQIMAGKDFSEFTYKNHKRIGWGCFIMALACWIYADIYAPLKDLYLLWQQLK